MKSEIAVNLIRALLAIGLVVLATGPWLFPTTSLRLFTEFYCVLVLAVMWNILAGYAGIVTVGQHAFVGVGAYAFFGFTMLGAGSPYLALFVAASCGLLISIPTLAIVFRLRTAYLAIGTWVVAEILLLVAGKIPGFGYGAGASLTADVIKSFGASASERYQVFYSLSFLMAVIAFGSSWVFLGSARGLALKAMRDNEEAAEAVGVNTNWAKILCYVLVTPFLSLTGALLALQKGRISPAGSFSLTDFTVYIIFIVLIGGIGSIEGPLIGTILFFVLREYLASFGSSYLIILGLASVAVIVLEPNGIWGLIRRHLLARDVFPITHKMNNHRA